MRFGAKRENLYFSEGLAALKRALDRPEQNRDDEQDEADDGKPEQALNEKPCDGKHSPNNEYENEYSQHALKLSFEWV